MTDHMILIVSCGLSRMNRSRDSIPVNGVIVLLMGITLCCCGYCLQNRTNASCAETVAECTCTKRVSTNKYTDLTYMTTWLKIYTRQMTTSI